MIGDVGGILDPGGAAADAEGFLDLAAGDVHAAGEFAPVPDDVALATEAAADFPAREGIVTGDKHAERALEGGMACVEGIGTFLLEAGEPDGEEGLEELHPAVGEADGPVFIVPERAELPAGRQADNEEDSF